MSELNRFLYRNAGCVLALVAVGLLVWGAVVGIAGIGAIIGNLFNYGEFAVDSRAAELEANLDNPSFFAGRAAVAKVSVEPIKEFGFNAHEGHFYVVLTLHNDSNESHPIFLEPIKAKVQKAQVQSNQRGPWVSADVFINCEEGNSRMLGAINLSPNSATTVTLTACTYYTTWAGQFVTDPTPMRPAVVSIDGYPVSGGSPRSAGIVQIPRDTYSPPPFIKFPDIDKTNPPYS